MLKKIQIFLLLPLLLLSLSAGSAQACKKGSESRRLDIAQTIIELFNTRITDGIRNFSSPDFNTVTDDQKLQEIYGQLKENGNLEKFTKSSVEDVLQDGKSYTVIVQYAVHSVNNLIYTVSLDENMQLAGFYYKRDYSLPQAAEKRYARMAQKIIAYFNAGQKEKIRSRGSALFNEALNDETLELVCKFLKDCGPVTAFTETETAKTAQNDEIYTTVTQHTKYAKKDIVFTISFDTNDKLVGFYYY